MIHAEKVVRGVARAIEEIEKIEESCEHLAREGKAIHAIETIARIGGELHGAKEEVGRLLGDSP